MRLGPVNLELLAAGESLGTQSTLERVLAQVDGLHMLLQTKSGF